MSWDSLQIITVKATNYFPHIGMKLLFAFTSASIKDLIKFITLAERRASAQVVLTSNDRVSQCDR